MSKTETITTALKDTVLKFSNLMHEEFNSKPFNSYHHQATLNSIRTFNYHSKDVVPSEVKKFNTGNVYYFSIKETILNYLKNSNFFDELIKERSERRSVNVISSIFDLESVKDEEAKLISNEMNLFFDIYYDDKNLSTQLISNPNTNMSLVYLSIASIAYKYQSKRATIGLIAVARKNTVKEISITEFFKPIKDEIIQIQPDQNSVLINNYKINFKFFSVKNDAKGA